MTASWLRQMGWRDAFVLADDLAGEAQETGAEKPRTLDPPQGTPTIDVPALAARLAEGTAVVVDLASSLEYRAAHIPGAWFAIRSRLGDALTKLPPAGALVFTSPDGLLALYAARDAAALSDRAVLALAGGTASWRAAGLDLDAGEERLADATDDVWYKPYDHPGGVEAAMRDYLRWEVALVEQIARDGDARFEAFARD
jgi:rhodanese-related sulfurtransferase